MISLFDNRPSREVNAITIINWRDKEHKIGNRTVQIPCDSHPYCAVCNITHITLSSSVCMHVRACECTEVRGVVEIGAETAAQAAWSAQGAAVGLQEGVHAEGTPRTSHWTPQTTTAANWHGLWEGGEGRRTTHRGNEDEERGGRAEKEPGRRM